MSKLANFLRERAKPGSNSRDEVLKSMRKIKEQSDLSSNLKTALTSRPDLFLPGIGANNGGFVKLDFVDDLKIPWYSVIPKTYQVKVGMTTAIFTNEIVQCSGRYEVSSKLDIPKEFGTDFFFEVFRNPCFNEFLSKGTSMYIPMISQQHTADLVSLVSSSLVNFRESKDLNSLARPLVDFYSSITNSDQ